LKTGNFRTRGLATVLWRWFPGASLCHAASCGVARHSRPNFRPDASTARPCSLTAADCREAATHDLRPYPSESGPRAGMNAPRSGAVNGPRAPPACECWLG